MKLKSLKALGLALLLPFLASCDFIDNIVGNLVLDLAFEQDVIMNKIDVTTQERITLSAMPTSAEKRLDVTYGLELLAFPRDVKVEEFKDYPINFTYKFSDDARDLFFEAVEEPEATEEASASVTAFYPLGTLEKPEPGTELRELKNFLNPESFVSLSKEPDVNFTVEVTGKVKKVTKSVKYFFKLTADGLPKLELPDPEADVDVDHLLVFKNDGETKTKTFELSAASLSAGVDVPFQVAWINLDDLTDTRTAEIVITVTNDLSGYDVTAEDPDTATLTINQTVAPYNLHIKKTGATEPLSLKFSVKLTVNE